MSLLALVMVLGLSACSWETIHTEHYTTDENGNVWERHYLVIPYDSPCNDESCIEVHKGEPTYNMKTHKMEGHR